MAIETTKNHICINQIIGQKNETIMIEGDSIIPDIKPDILNAIHTSGNICIYKKEILDGKVRIDGTIDAYIIYLADDEKGSVRSINSNVDFTEMIDMETATSNMILDTNFKLRSIECKVLNGRKINIKAILDAELKISANEEFEMIQNVNLDDVQLLNRNFNINLLVGNGETKVYAKDTFVIDSVDNLAEVMKANVKIINKEVKISYNKVLAKSDLYVNLLYLTEDNRINSVEGNIPVMGFIDISDITDDNICDVRYEIKNLLIKPNNTEDHSIYVEAEVLIYCHIYKNQEVDVIQDLYSPSTNLLFTQRQVRVMQQKEIEHGTCNIRENQMISELRGNKIYDVGVHAEIQNQTLLNDRILYEGEVSLDFIYSSNSNSLDTKNVKIPFNFNMDFKGVNANSSVETNIEIGVQDFVVTADDSVDIKIDLNFTTSMSRNTEINIIDDIKEDEDRNMHTYSMVVYFVKTDDSLWKIAKKFGSTMDEIARINGIDPASKLNIGQQLFIPRYHG